MPPRISDERIFDHLDTNRSANQQRLYDIITRSSILFLTGWLVLIGYFTHEKILIKIWVLIAAVTPHVGCIIVVTNIVHRSLDLVDREMGRFFDRAISNEEIRRKLRITNRLIRGVVIFFNWSILLSAFLMTMVISRQEFFVRLGQ